MGICVPCLGTRTRFYSGDADSDLDAAGWSASNSMNTIHPVGQKKANPFGLYDMHGNVWQWCSYFRSENYTVTATDNKCLGDEDVLRIFIAWQLVTWISPRTAICTTYQTVIPQTLIALRLVSTVSGVHAAALP